MMFQQIAYVEEAHDLDFSGGSRMMVAPSKSPEEQKNLVSLADLQHVAI